MQKRSKEQIHSILSRKLFARVFMRINTGRSNVLRFQVSLVVFNINRFYSNINLYLVSKIVGVCSGVNFIYLNSDLSKFARKVSLYVEISTVIIYWNITVLKSFLKSDRKLAVMRWETEWFSELKFNIMHASGSYSYVYVFTDRNHPSFCHALLPNSAFR